MKNGSKQRIFEYIQTHKQSSVDEIYNNLGISRQLTHRHLNSLLKEKNVEKIGSPPRVYYVLSEGQKKKTEFNLSQSTHRFIQDNYLLITPTGEIKPGINGFTEWCEKQDLPVEKTAQEYQSTLNKYIALKKDGFINGMQKIQSTFDTVYIDKLYYLDFYSIERFGKTKLGQKLLYAKQSQNTKLMKELSEEINPKIEKLITDNNVEAIGFIPPTVKREIQFIRVIEKNLNTKLPVLTIKKVKSEVAVPQKTLSKLEDRIENAKKTIVVDEKRSYDTVLLVDDAVGSGSTLNETAKSIKEKGVSKVVIGLSITGSFKGFDVISEV